MKVYLSEATPVTIELERLWSVKETEVEAEGNLLIKIYFL
jgi:hypothetical protein